MDKPSISIILPTFNRADTINNAIDSILNQTFNNSLTYKSQTQYSDTLKLEKKSIETLINNTYQELIVKLSQLLASK